MNNKVAQDRRGSKLNFKLIQFLFSIIILSSSCKDLKEATKDKHNADSTKDMIRVLDSIVMKIKPLSIPFDNNANAQYLAEMIKANPNDLNTHVVYFKELLFAGQVDQAIKGIEDLKKFIKPDPEVYNYLDMILALAYMRMAEVKNCQENHNSQSCLLPFEGGAIHTDPKGSEKAMEILLRLLKANPNDKVCVWLLNIAAITLGRHPQAVPVKFRIDPKHFNDTEKFPRFQNIAGYNGTSLFQTSGGMVIEDYDGDGYLDIITSGYTVREKLKFLKNDGNGQFIDRTKESGMENLMGGLNIIHSDFNNDGLMDVTVLRGGWIKTCRFPLSVLKNQGKGVFKDVTKEIGLYKPRSTQAAVYADFNNDGFLDFFVGNESVNGDLPLELFLNDGQGKFLNVIKGSGLEYDSLFVKGVACGDFNNDSKVDLYISVLGGNNKLFINESFNQQLKFRLIDLPILYKPLESFPTWVMDFNNDGWLDIFCATFNYSRANYSTEDLVTYYNEKKFKAEISRMYINKGNVQFEDISEKIGLNQPLYVMGSSKGDINNDAFEDLYLGTGEPSFAALIPNKMFLNDRGEKLKDVSYSGGFAHIQKGHAVSMADIDMDGDLDVLEEMGGAFEGDAFYSVFYENPGMGNHFIQLRLKGIQSNSFGAHARVRVYYKENGVQKMVHKQMDAGGSFGASPYILHFGLAKAQAIDSVVVYWPTSNTSQNFSNVALDGFYRLEENNHEAQKLDIKPIKWDKTTFKHQHN